MKFPTIRWLFGALFVVGATVIAAVASAHVTVWPRASTTGAHEKYTVRVPTEGAIATASIELAIPTNVTFVSIAVPNGYTYELKKAEGRVVAIVWSMQIHSGEFAEFSFMARNPKDGREIVWKATQRFIDGTSTLWSGSAGDKHPASVTTLSAAEDAHSH